MFFIYLFIFNIFYIQIYNYQNIPAITCQFFFFLFFFLSLSPWYDLQERSSFIFCSLLVQVLITFILHSHHHSHHHYHHHYHYLSSLQNLRSLLREGVVEFDLNFTLFSIFFIHLRSFSQLHSNIDRCNWTVVEGTFTELPGQSLYRCGGGGVQFN